MTNYNKFPECRTNCPSCNSLVKHYDYGGFAYGCLECKCTACEWQEYYTE